MLTFVTPKIQTLNLSGCTRCDAALNVGDVVEYKYPLAYCADCAPKLGTDKVVYSSPCGCEDFPCCGH